MKSYKFWNNSIGWLVFAIATFVFVSTAERTTSWWDCGEYISTAFKLQVGHPPGAPTFQWLGGLFSLLAFGEVTKVGFLVNVMSALCSSFTILFLFWTITLLSGKLVKKLNGLSSSEEFTLTQKMLVFGSAAVGALAYTFSDSFWFSAVEGEVYAMSSFFTAITFWSILKWEAVADQPHHLRWLIFIAFLIGLAIGVHLLNLLVIPAVVYIIYYKKFKSTKAGFWKAAALSLVLLGAILWGVVPYTVKLAGMFELFAVNSLGLPFNVGTVIYFALLIGAIVWGIIYAIKKNKVVLHTSLLCFAFILIGYSTFFILVIRSNAGVPINENEPKNAISLLAYLNREQYGTRPLLYGQYFNAKAIEMNETSSQYDRNDETGKYDLIGHNYEYKFDPAYSGLFPRMHSQGESGGKSHIQYYKFWTGTDGVKKPTAGENLTFLFRYHLDWMYFRYFMWNFAGRQNNIQGLGFNPDGSKDVLNGNWITGIKFIDEMRLGPQSNLPKEYANNQARNVFFALPLLLGLLGLWFQYKKDKKDSFVVFLLFFMTGLAIILYLNQPSAEPRERDYAYAGSFYAFAIWIGFGVMGLYELCTKYLSKKIPAIAVVVLSLLLVPTIMAKEGWDDHDRSNRTSAYDFGKNALLSCDQNGVLIANGDNDTFPLWYCQEVEGIRTDVRVINSALAASFWHVQPLFKQIYDSKPLQFTVPYKNYGQGKNDQVLIEEKFLGDHIELIDLLKFVGSDDPGKKRMYGSDKLSFLPTNYVKLTLNKEDLLKKGIITPQQAENTPDMIKWQIKAGSNTLYKNDLAFLDIVASNPWDRPLYFMSSGAQSSILPLPAHSQMEGSVYKFVPFQNSAANTMVEGESNGINTDKTYDLYVNKFNWGNINDAKTALDPESAAYARMQRYQYALLANALYVEGKKDSAIKVLDKSLYFFPDHAVPYDEVVVMIAQTYFAAGAKEQGAKALLQVFKNATEKIAFFEGFPLKYKASMQTPLHEAYGQLYRIALMAKDTPEFEDLGKQSMDMLQQRGLLQ